MSKLNLGRVIGIVLILALLSTLAVISLAQSDEADEQTASLEENKAFILEYFDAINGSPKPLSLLEQYIAESDQVLIDHIAMFEAAFPLYELVPEMMIAEDDYVFVHVTFRGTHAAEFAGIAPTNVEVEIPIALWYRIEDGRIAEHWMLADVMTMMQQLNEGPAAATTQ